MVDGKRNEPLIERIEARLGALGLSANAASEAAGLERTYIRNILNGRSRGPRGENAVRLAKSLHCSLEWLLSGEEEEQETLPGALNPADDIVLAEHRVPARSEMPRDLPVLGAAAGARSETEGAVVMGGGPVEFLRRPAVLQGVQDAYVVYIVNDSMEPAFPHGEAACVHPHRPVKPGDNVVIQVRDESGDIYAYVKVLVRRTDAEVVCRQHNPAREIAFPRSSVVSIHKILSVSELIGY